MHRHNQTTGSLRCTCSSTAASRFHYKLTSKLQALTFEYFLYIIVPVCRFEYPTHSHLLDLKLQENIWAKSRHHGPSNNKERPSLTHTSADLSDDLSDHRPEDYTQTSKRLWLKATGAVRFKQTSTFWIMMNYRTLLHPPVGDHDQWGKGGGEREEIMK